MERKFWNMMLFGLEGDVLKFYDNVNYVLNPRFLWMLSHSTFIFYFIYLFLITLRKLDVKESF